MSEECNTCVEHDHNPIEMNMDFEDLMDRWQMSTAEFLAAAGQFALIYEETLRELFVCMDCFIDTKSSHDYYTVYDKVWLEAVPDGDGMLCIKCLSKRLGRKLNMGDFPPNIPVNEIYSRMNKNLRTAMRRKIPLEVG